MGNSNNQTQVFVINLPKRVDRKLNSLERLTKVGLNAEVFAATDGSKNLDSPRSGFAPNNVNALWDSHKRIWEKFVSLDQNLCFVFEDDVEFDENSAKVIELIVTIDPDSFDIIQLGFLPLSARWNNALSDYFFIISSRVKSCIWSGIEIVFGQFLLKIGLQNSSYLKRVQNRINRASSETEFAKHMGEKIRFIREFRSGTHAYIISRSGAEKMIRYNQPVILGADLAFQMLAISQSLRIFRLEFSIAGQDNSIPSIGEHYKIPGDIGSYLIGGQE